MFCRTLYYITLQAAGPSYKKLAGAKAQGLRMPTAASGAQMTTSLILHRYLYLDLYLDLYLPPSQFLP